MTPGACLSSKDLRVRTAISATLRLDTSWTPFYALSAAREAEIRAQVSNKLSPAIASLPGIRLLTTKLFAKVLTNERMNIEKPRILRILTQDRFAFALASKLVW